MYVRRGAFPLILLLFMAGLGTLLYVSPDLGPGTEQIRQLLGMESASSSAPPAQRSSAAAGTTATGAVGGTAASGTGVPGTGESASGGLGTGYANLSVFSEPAEATVLVDGDSVGTTPLNRYPIRSGVYIITVEREGFFTADTVAILRNNQAPTYSVSLNPRPDLTRDESPAVADQPRPSSQPPTQSPSTTPPPSTENNPTPDPAPVPTTGTLSITSTPSGARVQLDGNAVGTTPLTLDEIEAGTHNVVFSREGYETSSMQVTVTPGSVRDMQVALDQLMGRLRVLVRPWGSIYIDGQLRERNADVWFETEVPAGEHEISAVHPALGQQTRNATVEPGEELSVVIDLRNSAPSSGGGAEADTSASSSRF
jgi:hypothetical protein